MCWLLSRPKSVRDALTEFPPNTCIYLVNGEKLYVIGATEAEEPDDAVLDREIARKVLARLEVAQNAARALLAEEGPKDVPPEAPPVPRSLEAGKGVTNATATY